ncbi:1-deoxy-D-xylulose-5-phosphate synthase [Candidatus Sulfidibacterium hydrothermale]|uniref:1-deoxy-D-xylulose-5-phosphate synthase n=1 Tax=Candidatus Sulfidibacterium hydrothermale TaxID=2875962 RepID=UPI001F0A7794|nr:1-deoxy-D-xylulose-5-phosphate synthase [Candidatus Sulfidibacterium hydrothermale]UBM62198.1 1-deoxy-D-xylulose-5-phosphate synthase [Candidatus Sulfidibacterium hydrothermale]
MQKPKPGSLLASVRTPADLKKLSRKQLPQLAEELRNFILDVVSVHPGHLGSSLGVVELSIALHYVFNTPYDRLIWDVGHQAYAHKILTGRRDAFHTLRQLGGISGFPSLSENEYDTFGTGHASTSISAALGMATASVLKGEKDRHHIAVIGDGAMTGGMAIEGLNNAGASHANLLIILNDNGIAIDKNTGVMKEAFLRSSHLFEAFHFHYFGPVDGNDIPQLLDALEETKKQKGPKLLHIITTKGKGFREAEKKQTLFHAPGRFDRNTGALIAEDPENRITYQEVYGRTLLELAEKNKKIVAVTPAMPSGSALTFMMEKFPERVFDTGIAEQHAVTFSAGLAAADYTPFCTIYSTFLQRAYDQVIHDVALQKLPVVFGIDRAGLVGADGATHHGVFDLAFLNSIPDMVVAAPMNETELRQMMFTASQYKAGPFAIRYPRGYGFMKASEWKQPFETLPVGKGRQVKEGENIALVCIGQPGNFALEAARQLEKENIRPAVFDLRFLKPLDEALLHTVFRQYPFILTIEDGVMQGGLASAIASFAVANGYTNPIKSLGVPDRFIPHGSKSDLYRLCGFDVEGIVGAVKEMVG